ncbi:MAG: DUF350 domain-containing protein [Ghiorsea sp.]|nr:DUF350 domain-containing protein [Ghiorsea sp.]
MSIIDGIFQDFINTSAFVIMYVVLFFLAKWFKDFLTPYRIHDELTEKDNLAIALIMCGYYFATVAIFVGALTGPSQGLINDLMQVGGYSILGLVFLNLSRFVNDKLILRTFCNVEKLTQDQNVAVGAVQFGTYVATGMIAAGAVMGTGGGVATAVVFFILGQLSLFLFSYIYDFITPYSIQEAIGNGNVAAGTALGGTLIALGVIVSNGVAGDFVSWQVNLTHLALVNVMAFVFLPLVRLMMDKLVIPGADLSEEIIRDKNLGAGFLEATVAISFAIVLRSVL